MTMKILPEVINMCANELNEKQALEHWWDKRKERLGYF